MAGDVCESNSLMEVKYKLLAKVRPDRKSVYEIHYMHGIQCLTKLQLRFSPFNEHQFQHNFDCLNPVCVYNTDTEVNEHFLLHFPLYYQMLNDLFGHLSEILG